MLSHTTREHLNSVPTIEKVAREVRILEGDKIISVRPFLRHQTSIKSPDGKLGYGMWVITFERGDNHKRFTLRTTAHRFVDCPSYLPLNMWMDGHDLYLTRRSYAA